MEIGGYMSMEMNYGEEFHRYALKFNSGRNALRVVLKNRKYKRIFLPYYICNSVIEACTFENCAIEYYNIDATFRINKDLQNFCQDTDCLYIVNYFGSITDGEIIKYSQQYKNIIVDNVQAFFVKPVLNIDTIYSCRKFFGVPDGAYLYTNCYLDKEYTQDLSYERMKHILGRYERCGEDFYEDYLNNEKVVDTLPVRYMSKITENVMKGIDYNLCRERRRKNYVYLYDNLQARNQIDLSRDNRGLFAFPLYIDAGEMKRLYLIEKKIFIPQYWKEVKGRVGKNTIEYKFASNILWIPCDHRYDREQMEYMVSEIKKVV